MMTATAMPPGMMLGELMGDAAPAALAAHRVVDLTLDSRSVVPGSLFVAVPGTREHGLRHAAAAAAAGATFIAWEPVDGVSVPALPASCTAFAVPDLRARLGVLADRFFGTPSARLAVVGITGTNGKTTCTHLVAGALERLGRRAGVIGTLGSGPVGALRPAALTTPDVIEVHRALAESAGQGLQAVAMEVSSHALDQGRVDAVRYAVAAFTNLSRDHLDYHGDLDAYAECKARLFLAHRPAASVINIDDAFGRSLFSRLGQDSRAVGVGRGIESSVRLQQVEAREDGLVLQLGGAFGEVELHSPLVGEFNAENLALAFAVLLAMDVDAGAAAKALEGVPAPAGRMEAFADRARDVLAVVDYAHTPDALAKALAALRHHCRGRLWCVFGCGGERDRGKRPAMGRVAEQLADEVVITDDNPRGEDGRGIVVDILAGLEDAGRARIERDRAAAIRQALGAAQPGDVVLIAGKGHEDVQLVAGERRPFSDRALAASLTGGAL